METPGRPGVVFGSDFVYSVGIALSFQANLLDSGDFQPACPAHHFIHRAMAKTAAAEAPAMARISQKPR